MGNKLNEYLGLTPPTILKDYQHASRLYVDNNYGHAPKVGFLYYVKFNLNSEAVPDGEWKEKHQRDIGLLVKKIDLPKFTVTTETLNQYNRKTVVATKLSYTPVNVEFHDDNLDIINKLWMHYYNFYFADEANAFGKNYGNTKYKEKDNLYGIRDHKLTIPFFDSIDIYTLHQQQYTQITLVNPKITEWQHDVLNQAEGNKIQQNRMAVAYEAVMYNYGYIKNNPESQGFITAFYDKNPSPLVIGGNDQNTGSDALGNGQNTGSDALGDQQVFNNVTSSNTQFDKKAREKQFNQLLAVSKGNLNYVNDNGIVKVTPGTYNIASGPLGTVTKTVSGKYALLPSTESQPGIFQVPGGIGINIFKAANTSVDGKIRASPAALIFPPNSIIPSTPSATLPGIPIAVIATATGQRTINIQFTPPESDGGSPITSYSASSEIGGISSTINSSSPGWNTSTFFITGLAVQSPYRFRVRATNSVGTGGYSSYSNTATTYSATT